MRDGMFIEVWFDQSSASVDLLEAADGRRLLDLHALYSYVDGSFRGAHPLPRRWVTSEPLAVPASLERTGECAGFPVQLYRGEDGYTIRHPTPVGGNQFAYMAHHDLEFLDRVFAATVGEVSWAEAPVASRV